MSDLISRKAAIDAVHCRVELANKIEAMAMTSAIAEIARNIASLPSAEAVQGWIPCSERLPDEYDEYLCQYDDGDMIVGWLENEEWCKKCVAKEKIVAWMPLPEPYKVGAEE